MSGADLSPRESLVIEGIVALAFALFAGVILQWAGAPVWFAVVFYGLFTWAGHRWAEARKARKAEQRS